MAEQAAVRTTSHHLRPSLGRRVYGLGSVFGKTLRDQRWAIVGIAVLMGAINAGTATQIAAEFGTVEARRMLAAQMEFLPPIFHGLIGEPINVETLPGFLSWRLTNFMPILVGIWAIVVLSGTVAGEAARGTLELVLSTPVSRASLAFQKLAAIVVALVAALAVAALITWSGTVAFATLPGDETNLPTVLAEFTYVGAMTLLFGCLAFALGPLVGRGIAAGIAAAAMFGSYIVNGYGDLVPGFDVARVASPFHWAVDHRPMAGSTDWPALVPLFGLAALFALVGVVLFARRDLARTVALPGGGRASRLAALAGRWGVRGPLTRSFGERWPAALAWGAGVGAYGLFIAVSAREFGQLVESLPQLGQIVERFYPGVDLTSAGGLLQLTMFNFSSLMFGLAAATLVGGWASDETDRRLEIVLSTPIRRTAWALRSGAGVLAAVLLMTLALALGVGIGVTIMGDPLSGPIAGSFVLGLYAAALAGVGLLVAGLGWPARAGLVVAALTIGMWLLDFIGSALNLPADVLNLALTRHLGQPMAGIYNEVGMLACAVMALGGLLAGAWAFRRRDLAA